jgi:adenine-specific DNA-methyltransferase
LLKSNGVRLQNLGFGAWQISSNNEQRLRAKIESIGIELKNWNVKINFGIKTGLNEAFIIDQATRDKLVAEDPSSTTIIKPILQGRDIERYVYEWRQKWIIATFPALSFSIDQFPAIKKHLLSFGIEKLEQSGKLLKDGSKARKKTNNKWYETQDTIAYWEELAKEKIVWKRIGSILRFAYDSDGMYAQDSTCIMTGPNLKYLCAYLNSKLGRKLLFDKAPKTGTGDLIISVQALDPLPVPPINQENRYLIEKIEDLFEMIYKIKQIDLNSNSSAIDNQIDQVVYKLYDLTEEEIRIVEDQISASIATKPILESTQPTELTEQIIIS